MFSSLADALKDTAATIRQPQPDDPALLDYSPIREASAALAVVEAQTAEDVVALMRWAHAHGAPVVPRGAGTGLSGGANAVEGGIVLDLLGMNRIVEINPVDQIATVEPGVINAALDAAAAQHGLMYAPDPASFRLSTIGGNIGTNAGGLRCAKYGVTKDSILGLDVVLADGTRLQTGTRTFKGVVGFDLTRLIVGSEGTLAVVVGATVRLRPRPTAAAQRAFVFPSVAGAAAGVLAIGAARVQPAVVEFLDRGTLESIDLTTGSELAPLGEAVLLVETDGFGADAEMAALTPAVVKAGGRVALEGAEAAELLDLRRQTRGDLVDHSLRVGEDIAVPRSQLVAVVENLSALAEKSAVNLKIVAHAGDGNLHPTFWLPEVEDDAERAAAVSRLENVLDESVRAALALGGTITGEHGVGMYKRRWMAWEQSRELIELQRRIKRAFDPQGILNPGKALPDLDETADAQQA
jgi:glycolate oxidase